MLRLAKNMTSQQQELQQKVRVLVSPRMDCPLISLSNLRDATLKLRLTICQVESPFPDRPIILLTKYSCLDATSVEDAFFWRAISSPKLVDVSPDRALQPSPTYMIPLQPPPGTSNTQGPRFPNLLDRSPGHGFRFITIPPVGKGVKDIFINLSPWRIVQYLGSQQETVAQKMERYFRPGDSYRFDVTTLGVVWWGFGNMEDPCWKTLKISRWSFPDSLPLKRDQQDEETDKVAQKLRDLVDKDTFSSAFFMMKQPNVRKMRADGWIFGEPQAGLEMVRDFSQPFITFVP